VSSTCRKPPVLVVDDDESSRLLLNAKLKSAGYESCHCTSGSDALEILSRHQFDAIISDLYVSGVTGFDLLEATGRCLPHAAFLMATGVNDISVGIAAMNKGAADYLLKPFQLDAVIVSLERALGIKQLEAELENYQKHLDDTQMSGRNFSACMRMSAAGGTPVLLPIVATHLKLVRKPRPARVPAQGEIAPVLAQSWQNWQLN